MLARIRVKFSQNYILGQPELSVAEPEIECRSARIRVQVSQNYSAGQPELEW